MEVMMFVKFKIYAILAVLFLVLASGLYHTWKRQIQAEELAKFNQAQLEQTMKDNAEFQKKMEEIQQNQIDIIKKNDEAKAAFEQKLSDVNAYLNSDATKKEDVKSSSILKQTIIRLQGAVK
jgi:uncharacterized membrane protein YhiD involved in acid resistance